MFAAYMDLINSNIVTIALLNRNRVRFKKKKPGVCTKGVLKHVHVAMKIISIDCNNSFEC